MRIMIVGASGMLGHDLVRVFRRHDLLLADLKIEGPDSAIVDITNFVALKKIFDSFKPEAVINASAYTDVDGCEDNVNLAYKVNSDGARNLALCVKELQNCVFVHVSTDYVFDGESGKPYVETDPVNPLGVYGKSKLDGENQIRKVYKDHIIARTALLYGKNRQNFVSKILERAENNLPITVPDDMIGSPTYSLELARIIERLVFTGKPGIYHTVNKGWCSRYEWAKKICEIAGLKADIKPIKSSTLVSKAKRPVFSALINKNLEDSIGDSMKTWEAALEEFIRKDLNYNPSAKPDSTIY